MSKVNRKAGQLCSGHASPTAGRQVDVPCAGVGAGAGAGIELEDGDYSRLALYFAEQSQWQ